MYTKWYVFLLAVIINCIGVNSRIIQLTPAEVRVVENSSATITCSKTNGFLAETTWTNSQIKAVKASLVFFNNQCITTLFLKDSDLFTGVCNSNGTYSVVLKKIDRKQHGAEWMCDDPTDTNIQPSEKVVIDVSVPATSVTLYPYNREYMKENQSETITCETSACRPNPRVQWYLSSNKTSILYNLTQFSTDKEYGLTSVESKLDLKPNRTINGFHIYCEVWSDSNKSDITSRYMILNVTYSSNDPPKIDGYDNNKKYSIIESEVGKLVCSVYGGNPLPKLTWNCYNDTQLPDTTDGKTVTKSVTWIGTRGQTSCSCTSTHSWSGTTMSTNISLNILFPSEIKTFSLSSISSEEGTAVINETDNATIVCLAEANPSSNLAIENRRFGVISEASDANIVKHSFHNASYIDAGEYTCRGRNAYTSGLSASSHLILIVKCPPRPSSDNGSVVTVTTVLSVDVILSFSAWMYLDVPNKTIFKWFRGNELISENDKTYIIRSEELQTNLSILNTTDQDLGLYRVSVRNSVGEYNHYYVLNAAVPTERPTDVVCSTNTGALIGVGAGTFLFTLMLVVFSVCGYNLLKKHKFSNQKSHKQGDSHGHRLSVTEGSQCTSNYTDLDVKTKESNEYDAVNIQGTSSEQQDLSIQGTSAYIKMKDAKDLTKDTLDYINIKI